MVRFLAIIQDQQCAFLNFHVFSVFHAIFHVNRYLSFIFRVFQFSHHNPGPTECISHFWSFSLSLAIFQVLQCVCVSFYSFVSFLTIFQVLHCRILLFHVFSVSCHIPGHRVFVSHFPRFSVFSPLSRSYSVYFSFFYVFHCFFPCFSHFAVFSVFIAIFQVLPCEFLIFLVGQFSRHIPIPTVCISHLSRFQCFLSYSGS